MRPFQYSLQAALDHAREAEHGAASALGIAAAAFASEISALGALDARTDVLRGQLLISGARTAAAFADIDRALVDLAARRTARARTVEDCRAGVAERRAGLARLAQRRAVLERHRDRKRAEYDALAELRENAALDEGNLLRSSYAAQM